MRNMQYSGSRLSTYSLSLLISALGTAIFTFATLIVFLVFGLLIPALIATSIIFFIVTLIALILFLHGFLKLGITREEYKNDDYRGRS